MRVFYLPFGILAFGFLFGARAELVTTALILWGLYAFIFRSREYKGPVENLFIRSLWTIAALFLIYFLLILPFANW